jgi:lipoprotein-anchoring transpeptidase ErfK/SrfK
MVSRLLLIIALGLLNWPALAAPRLDPPAVNDAQPSGPLPTRGVNALVVKLQVLLDRASFSPGEIDGRLGENLKKAMVAFAEANNFKSSEQVTPELWSKLAVDHTPITNEYTLTDDDVRGPFLDKLPAKMEAMKNLPALSYTSVREALAEKFHMSEELLDALNPGKSFEKAGETITVVQVRSDKLTGDIARIVVDKNAQTVRVFNKAGGLVAFYPATVGSNEKPAPSGTLRVTKVANNPPYEYNPDYAFKGVRSKERFTIKPGPNNPVGAVWIGLSEKSYGIHGTPYPSKVSKSESHGCVRLTNWDARHLASGAKKGTVVEFTETRDVAQADKPNGKSAR